MQQSRKVKGQGESGNARKRNKERKQNVMEYHANTVVFIKIIPTIVCMRSNLFLG